MVATGQFQPYQPFFFIHEYKREQNKSGDVVGQLLATMYVAKLLNATPLPPSLFVSEEKTYDYIPLYGAYIIGRMWFFTRLKDNHYFISKAYNSTDKRELQEIYKNAKSSESHDF